MASHDHDDPSTTQRTLLSPGPDGPGPTPACLVVIHGEGLGRRVDVDARPVVVGRAPDADLQLPHASVSRRHCELAREGARFVLRDLGSTNGTLVNEQRVAEAALADGDHVTVGEVILKFIGQASVEARYHEEVYALATLDPLSGLCNRRHFTELVDKELARALRHDRHPVLCMLDVDLFKHVNDTHGHIAGDGVLRRIAELLREQVRHDELAARIGGEEFAVFFPEASLAQAEAFAERLRAAVEAEPFAPGGVPTRITISLGLAAAGAGREGRSALMHAADQALYRAKDGGRNRTCTAPPP